MGEQMDIARLKIFSTWTKDDSVLWLKIVNSLTLKVNSIDGRKVAFMVFIFCRMLEEWKWRLHHLGETSFIHKKLHVASRAATHTLTVWISPDYPMHSYSWSFCDTHSIKHHGPSMLCLSATAHMSVFEVKWQVKRSDSNLSGLISQSCDGPVAGLTFTSN